MPFAIIISEKGGAERRELFDKSEISVGRVQGNDLMLPKGNVSKRHARLMFRDGRFIVTDLKSTNGTYVNGRKIAQATIVREGDKIYVGDFVLRFEATPGTMLAPESAPNAPGPRDATASEVSSAGATGAPAARDPHQISHYPLENDPDEQPSGSAASPRVQVPQPPRVPSGFGPKGPGGTAMIGMVSPLADASPAPAAPPAPPAPPAAVPAPPAPPRPAISAQPAPAIGGLTHPAPAHPAPQPAAPSRAPAMPMPGEIRSPSREMSRQRDASAHAAHRLALATLVDRVAEMIDLDVLRAGTPADDALTNRIERAIREQSVSLKEDGEIPTGIDQDALARDAHRELLGLGPLGPLLDDEDVSEIHASQGAISVVRAGQGIVIEPPFSSEESMHRAIARLATQNGHPLEANETVVERTLPRNARLTAILSPTAVSGHVLTIRKRRRPEAGSEDLVRSGTVSRAMWTFLSQCIGAKLNVVVAAPAGVPLGPLVAALMTNATDGERVATVQSMDDALAPPGPGVVVIIDDDGARGEATVRAVTRLSSDRLVAGTLGGAAGAAVLDAIGEGRQGVIAIVRSPGLRQGLSRLVPELCAARPGLSPDVAREWLASAFDLGIELARLRDGRQRVLRVVEVSGIESGAVGLRDVFYFAVERAAAGGAVEGTFAPTGVVPRFVDDMRLRGIAVDPTLFDRQSVRSPRESS